MFKIGEFSKLTQVSIRMLRYYDEMGLLKPQQTDAFTGYRLYSAAQIPLLNKIVFLRDLDFTVAQIADALQHWDDAFIKKLLQQKQAEMQTEIETAQNKIKTIEQAKKDIGQEKIEIHYNVAIKPIPACTALCLRQVMPNYYAEAELWKEMQAFAAHNKVQFCGNTFTIYHDADYHEEGIDMEICAPVTKLQTNQNGFVYRTTEAVPTTACTMVYGGFENIAGAFYALADWL
ncbi:MAG: MerR family transcriptional regulator [Oscillospiraceae bacterium]